MKKPIRTCLGCRVERPKLELVRIVRGPEGVKIDQTGKKAGRGAYLCVNESCLEAALKRGGLAKSLGTKIAGPDLEEIKVGFLKLVNEQKVPRLCQK